MFVWSPEAEDKEREVSNMLCNSYHSAEKNQNATYAVLPDKQCTGERGWFEKMILEIMSAQNAI